MLYYVSLKGPDQRWSRVRYETNPVETPQSITNRFLACCFFDRWFFQFLKKEVLILDLDTIGWFLSSLRPPPTPPFEAFQRNNLTLSISGPEAVSKHVSYSEGKTLPLGALSTSVRGEPPRFLVFGGYMGELGSIYSSRTFIVERMISLSHPQIELTLSLSYGSGQYLGNSNHY